jgi:hypothetical protein
MSLIRGCPAHAQHVQDRTSQDMQVPKTPPAWHPALTSKYLKPNNHAKDKPKIYTPHKPSELFFAHIDLRLPASHVRLGNRNSTPNRPQRPARNLRPANAGHHPNFLPSLFFSARDLNEKKASPIISRVPRLALLGAVGSLRTSCDILPDCAGDGESGHPIPYCTNPFVSRINAVSKFTGSSWKCVTRKPVVDEHIGDIRCGSYCRAVINPQYTAKLSLIPRYKQIPQS